MTDKFDKATRSRIMSSIKGSNTKMELAVKPTLEALGFEYQPKDVFGNPDFAHKEQMVAVFLDGCFWHGCPEHYRQPETNVKDWAKKIDANRKRDIGATKLLEGSGWRVIRIWEHDLKRLTIDFGKATKAQVDAVADAGKPKERRRKPPDRKAHGFVEFEGQR
jgi:DNA mismatch endonuclease (patch repair protein)